MILVFKDGAVIATHEDHQRDRIAGAYPGARLLSTGADIAWDPDPAGFYPGRLAESQSAAFLADTGLEHVEGAWRVSLAHLRQLAIDRVNAAAGAARLRFVTDSPFQGTEYDLTLEEARAYETAGYTGDVPPMVQAEVDAQGLTAQQAAEFIIATATGWRTAAALIKAIRRAAIVSIEVAGDEQTIDTLVAGAETALAAVQPE